VIAPEPPAELGDIALPLADSRHLVSALLATLPFSAVLESSGSISVRFGGRSMGCVLRCRIHPIGVSGGLWQ
jgi:hypothetical protein